MDSDRGDLMMYQMNDRQLLPASMKSRIPIKLANFAAPVCAQHKFPPGGSKY